MRTSRPAMRTSADGPERDLVLVARIGAPQGLRGEVRLWTYGEDPMALKCYQSLQAGDGRTFDIEDLRPAKGFFIARLAGVNDRTAAEGLRDTDLYVPREQLPPTEEGEFYHADLIGLSAVTRDGRRVGEVTAIHNFGAGDLIEVRREGGPSVMLPFTVAAVPQVDIAGGRLVVDPPPGLLEDEKTGRAAGE
jgi:16S rRNA processing protein RimM